MGLETFCALVSQRDFSRIIFQNNYAFQTRVHVRKNKENMQVRKKYIFFLKKSRKFENLNC